MDCVKAFTVHFGLPPHQEVCHQHTLLQMVSRLYIISGTWDFLFTNGNYVLSETMPPTLVIHYPVHLKCKTCRLHDTSIRYCGMSCTCTCSSILPDMIVHGVYVCMRAYLRAPWEPRVHVHVHRSDINEIISVPLPVCRKSVSLTTCTLYWQILETDEPVPCKQFILITAKGVPLPCSLGTDIFLPLYTGNKSIPIVSINGRLTNEDNAVQLAMQRLTGRFATA